MRVFSLSLVFVLACASALHFRPARIDQLELESWREIRAPGFTLYSNAPPDLARRMTRQLVAFARVVDRMAPDRGREKLPAIVVLFRTYGQFVTFASPGIAGFMSPGLDENLLVSSCDGPAASTLFHEYVHLLMLGNLAFPAWYGEGFAELLGPTSIREDIAAVGGVPPDRRRWLQRSNHVSLEELLRTRYSLDLGRRTPGFYAESWLLAHYFHLGPRYGAPQRLPQLQNMLVSQNRGVAWREAFEGAFGGMTLDELQGEVDAHRQRILQLQDLPMIDFQLGALPEDFETRELSPAEAELRLGQLALSLGTPFAQLAEALFDAAHGHEPGNGAALIGLARSAALRGDAASADARIELAERSGAERGSVALARGEILMQRAEKVGQSAASGPTLLAEARSALQQATELAPELPAAWAALGETYAEDTTLDPTPGIAALERAHAAVGAHPGVEMNLGRLYARSGDPERARLLLSRVALLALDDEIARKAQVELDHLAAR